MINEASCEGCKNDILEGSFNVTYFESSNSLKSFFKFIYLEILTDVYYCIYLPIKHSLSDVEQKPRLEGL